MVDPRLRNRVLLVYTAATLGIWALGELRLWWWRTKVDAKAIVPWDWQAVIGWHPASAAPMHRGRR